MRGWAGILILAAAAHGQTAASVTERGAGLHAILDALLYPENAPARSILLVVDPTPSLNAARFPDTLAAVLHERRARTPRPQLGLAILGAKEELPPGATPEAIVAALQAALTKPQLEVRNVYEAARRSLRLLKGANDRRELLLVTLENGDLEDDVEKTADAAAKAEVTIHVLAREAFLSDSYWQSRTPPRGDGSFHGPDGAFVDVPWGWMFQRQAVTEAAPSGHAMYGLSRLATVTGGRVFVWYPSRGKHACQIFDTCTFCNGDHVAPLEVLRGQRVRAIAPLVGSRKEVLSELGKDGYYRAVLTAWDAAAKAGLVRTYPPVRRAGKRLAPVGKRDASPGLPSGTSWSRIARDADALARNAEKIAERLAAQTEKAEGSARSRSIAELTYLMLRITRVNLLLCAAYCREVAGRGERDVEPPERLYLADDFRVTGLGFRNLSLCHGIAPFAEVKLPGGKKLREEVEALGPVIAAFHKRNAYSPFAIAAARMGLASFHPVGIGKRTTPLPRDIRGSDTEPTNTRPDRGGGTSGGTGGPTSGGG